MFILLKADGGIEKIAKDVMVLTDYYKAIDCVNIGIRVAGMQAACIDKQMLVYDDEFLLKEGEPKANKLASALYGYHKHGQCLCGNVVVAKLAREDLVGFTEEEADKLVELFETVAALVSKQEFKVHPCTYSFLSI